MAGATQDESVVALIKDLTAKLAVVANGIDERIGHEAPPASTATPLNRARALIEQRRLRRRFLPEELFHEPAWDMLLALYVASHDHRVMNVKTLVSSADAPVTTSQRWIEHLAKLGLVRRMVDPIDRRRIEVSLSDDGRRAIEAYLAAIA
ncbi:DNA-binding MarR family transcriptional regulator [Sphingomonas sp. SORGH_AS802]|jgi:DNA-binding MarR family transcriptional regulator|uniref:hypothetical protein n=1 Tax=Sphingomonas sp. S-NIH.Pt15_0812 TaxID=1920129 RepID=UPI000F7DAB3B|nr:hypothetical protein [Sphingomonas sp. S-NIH.Pt15_0812]MDR6128481.1 DNA-binding MarR family transcriptional regulator [Sphingomonas sp. SORGH_AS_0438]MDR6135317.1 DNA-binding MarR family transcriptional regulator [Sphingomonas sp. SORGH_AS_0802]RSU46199.1 hypothetical protein BRX43_16195 [Sphingomonas sp. S-NIH.Pt15_0812]